ncbi:acid-amino acid ligase [Venturia nashicola]|nr:acid-amino acid ligase [Venturia nashicola]
MEGTAASIFCGGDICTLKDDPQHMGVVDRTTSEVSTHEPHPDREYDKLECHQDIPAKDFQCFKKTGIPPKDTVVVKWQTKPTAELIPTKFLVLYDRALLIGDIVKRHTKDSMSGTVVHTDVICTLLSATFKENIPNGDIDVVEAFASARLKKNDSYLTGVPAEELKLAQEYMEGDVVFYQNWIGRIQLVQYSVTLKLSNGFVVEVEHPHELESVPKPEQYIFNPGDLVKTKKGNLRRGRWIYGTYDANIKPHGVVVSSRAEEISVNWICRRIYPTEKSNLNPEPSQNQRTNRLETGGLLIYDRSRIPPTGGGFGRYVDILSGHRMRFKDLTGAVMKYNNQPGVPLGARHPLVNRLNVIPRTESLGFDINVFRVLDLTTTAKVLWQNCEITTESSRNLIPDINLEDESEVWPGEIVVSNEKTKIRQQEWIEQPDRVGIVQSVSAAERIAKILWLPKAKVQYSSLGNVIPGESDFDQLALLPGSTLGLGRPETMADAHNISDVTLYDIHVANGLNKRRGDLVILHPPASEGMDINTSNRVDWFGEVIDLGRDGFLTVRLGALEHVRDIRISPEYATIVYRSYVTPGYDSEDDSVGDSEFDSDEKADEDEDNSDDYPWLTNDGVPVSDIEDESWSTASSDAGDDVAHADFDGMEVDQDEAREDIIDEAMRNGDEPHRDPIPPPAMSELTREPSFGRGLLTEGAPPAFAILDSIPPTSHAYFVPPSNLTIQAMKRVTKEHQILQSSLPDGIFVRAWECRLDLLRILIVGPIDTPYEFAPFVIDMRIPENYPRVPPEAFFHSWTAQVNPNLYENGKICLSLLGTWHGEEKSENWSPFKSTILQLLVSLMGLVLVKQPYFLEAGYEARAGLEEAQVPSQLYSERTYFRTREFITHAISNGVYGFDDLIDWLYLDKSPNAPLLLNKAIEAAQEVVDADQIMEQIGGRPNLRGGLSVISKGAVIMLRRQKDAMERIKAEKGLQ